MLFWSDSKVVLGYIANESRRFHIFVANRVGFIYSNRDVSQWNYVPGVENIADLASRGGYVADFIEPRWFDSPKFLWYGLLPSFGGMSTDIEGGPELKKV